VIPDTLGRLFWDRVARLGDRPAQRVRGPAGWTDVSWRALGEEVGDLARGLVALGRRPGEAVALLAATRAEWVRADFAVLSGGGITVPVYPTYPASAVAHVAGDAGARTAIVENAAQLDKVRQAADGLPALDSVVVMEGEAPERVGRLRALSWAGLRALGREDAGRHEAAVRAALAAGRPEDVATIVYTSGTTGAPRGVVQTHGNHVAILRSVASVMGVREGEVHLLFLPLAHSFARLEAFFGVHLGLVTAFAESLDRLGDNLREVRPDFICGVPRVFEKVYGRIQGQVAGGPALRRRLFEWALGVGRRTSRHLQEGTAAPAGLRLQHALARRLVFARVHAGLGGRLRVAFSGGAPLAREIAEFFHALGILVLEGYGLTESCPVLAGNRPDRFRFGTVGLAYPGVELRIAEDGEVLARGPNVARGYHGRPEETAAVFGSDGWLRTGDVGALDADGFLRITDRKKDLIKTSGGSYVAPQHIENLLKGDPLVTQAMVEGDRRPYPVALVALAADELARFARGAGLGPRPAAELARHPAVVARVRRTVDAVNAQLAPYARIKRFAVVPAEFTQEGGELTPTLKVRRREVRAKYADLLESLYRD
jgi:long-chain acyl-CoA synthetase